MDKETTIGFTGTREGMTSLQKLRVRKLISNIEPYKVVHGDCIGADSNFNDIVVERRLDLGNTYILIYLRPSNLRTRAYSKGADRIYEPRNPSIRDKEIVEDCDMLVATPKGYEEEVRSGTWTTIRYARKRNKPILIVWPDGTDHQEYKKAGFGE